MFQLVIFWGFFWFCTTRVLDVNIMPIIHINYNSITYLIFAEIWGHIQEMIKLDIKANTYIDP